MPRKGDGGTLTGGLEGMRQLFRRGWLRRRRTAIVNKLARKYLRNSDDVLANYGWVLNPDRPAMLAAAPRTSLRINWILPAISTAQGGWLSIVRTVRQMEEAGHENRLYILGGIGKGAAQARESISRSYFPIGAEIYPLHDPAREKIADSDALIATSWTTAYAARAIGNTARKYYFVQDLEYMFYAPGSLHTFARNTYRFGFQGIALGQWIASELRREYGMECTAFGFSYDREHYGIDGERMYAPGRKRVLFYARPETERRGFELGILALAEVARHLPEVELVLVGFDGRAVELPFKAVLPGVVPVSRLGALYRSCDAALVLSHTNLSLLPLELMACGCAVVSNSGPNVEWLLNQGNARVAHPDPLSLAAAVTDLLQDDAERQRLTANALVFAESTDWRREIKVVESVLMAGGERLLQMTKHD